MAKEVNIPVKAEGAEQAKDQLNGVAQAAAKIGDTAEETGRKSETGFGKVKSAFASLMGPLGIAGLMTMLAAGTRKVAEFFDTMDQRVNEAVRTIQQLRSAYDGLFEAMGAFDEKSRNQTVKDSLQLLLDTRVSKQIGLPVIEAYTRQFKGTMSNESFDEGLRGMLGYAARHGGAATGDLISMMAGFGMTDPEQQGIFRRQIASAAAGVGLTDADLIGAMSRGLPTIRAMGWSPSDAVANTAALAHGETGRQRTALPASTLAAMLDPNATAAIELGIAPAAAEDPAQLFNALADRIATMEPQSATQMLSKVYGQGGAVGVYKLMRSDQTAQRRALAAAAGPTGIAAEAAEEAARRDTVEGRASAAEAAVEMLSTDVTTEEEIRARIRQIGAEYLKTLQRRKPFSTWLMQATHFQEGENEFAAKQMWFDAQSDEYRAKDPQGFGWGAMTPAERFTSLQRAAPTVVNNYDYSTNLYRSEGQAAPRVSE